MKKPALKDGHKQGLFVKRIDRHELTTLYVRNKILRDLRGSYA
jgi:hypothetical protein